MFLHSYAHARFLREFRTSLHQLLASGPSLTDLNLLGNAFPRRKWRVANKGWREWRRIPTESLMPSRQQHGSSCTDAEDQIASGDPSSSPCGKCWFVWILGIKWPCQEKQAERSSRSVAFLPLPWHTCNVISSRCQRMTVLYHVWIMLRHDCLGSWNY